MLPKGKPAKTNPCMTYDTWFIWPQSQVSEPWGHQQDFLTSTSLAQGFLTGVRWSWAQGLKELVLCCRQPCLHQSCLAAWISQTDPISPHVMVPSPGTVPTLALLRFCGAAPGFVRQCHAPAMATAWLSLRSSLLLLFPWQQDKWDSGYAVIALHNTLLSVGRWGKKTKK